MPTYAISATVFGHDFMLHREVVVLVAGHSEKTGAWPGEPFPVVVRPLRAERIGAGGMTDPDS